MVPQWPLFLREINQSLSLSRAQPETFAATRINEQQEAKTHKESRKTQKRAEKRQKKKL